MSSPSCESTEAVETSGNFWRESSAAKVFCKNLADVVASVASADAYATLTLSSLSRASAASAGQMNSGNTLASLAGKVSIAGSVCASAATAAARTIALASPAIATQKGTTSCNRASSSATDAHRARSVSESRRAPGRTAPRTQEHTTVATSAAPGHRAPAAAAA